MTDIDVTKPPKLTGVIPQNGKKTKTPRQYDSILKGALALDLPERVNLKNELIKSIKKEVDDLQQQAAEAAKIAE